MHRGLISHSTLLLIHCRACSSTAAVAVNAKKAKRPPKKSEIPSRDDRRSFEKFTVKKIHQEYLDEQRRLSANLNKRFTETQVMRLSTKKNYAKLLSFVKQCQEAHNKRNSRSTISDELFTLCLLTIQRALRKSDPNTRESLGLFINSAKLASNLKDSSDFETRAAAALLLDAMEDWHIRRTPCETEEHIAEALEDVHTKFQRMARAMQAKPDLLKQNRIFFTDEDWAIVLRKVGEVPQNSGFGRAHSPETNQHKYDEGVRLTRNLNNPVVVDEYLGNPFAGLGVSKEDYMKMFEEQLEMECNHSLEVKNTIRTSKKIPAEKVIDRWKWREAIEDHLKKTVKTIRQAGLRNYLSVLPTSVITNSVMKSVLTTVGLGQNLVGISQMEYALAEPIIGMIHNSFINATVTNKKELATGIYENFVEYFVNDDVSRNYTVREWWSHCAVQAHLKPEFDFPFTEFDHDTRKELGNFLLQTVIDACKFPKETPDGDALRSGLEAAPVFSYHNVVREEESAVLDSENRINLSKMLKLNPEMMLLLEEHEFEFLRFPCDLLPMKVPPRPWLDGGHGGPLFTKNKCVLRNIEDFKRVDINYELQKRLKRKAQARPVFDALNDLGSTPWRINKAMLQILRTTFSMGNDMKNKDFLDKLSIPLHGAAVKIPDYVETFGQNVDQEDIDPEEWITYAREKRESLKFRNEQNSMWCWLMYRLVLAEHFADDVLFFPHNMDFRGRVYPISPYLSHMGDDINRAMLKFAKGKPLGDAGLDWLKLHCVNLTGKLKRESIATRMLHAEEVLPEIMRSAENPLDGKQWWMDSDDPWQTLAACMELRDAISCGNPSGFISHLPIHQDGSCNGLQHYAALGRDKQGGAEVNLLPSELPSDVYSSVAARVEQKRIEDENSSNETEKDIALALRQAMPEAVPRKVIKQTVMTTVYGVTRYGAVQQIKRQLKSLGIENEDAKRFASYLATKTFSSLHDAFTSSMELKDWFRQSAQMIVHLMRSVEWVTPLGLPVMQPYLRNESKLNKICMIPVPTKQVNAFPPNFVHSLDSTHMMLTTLNCRREGITFAAVHDCYWTHCSTVDQMNRICRDQFISLYKEPIVEQCAEFMRKTYLGGEVHRQLPKADLEHTLRVFTPEFKQGDLDIERVRDSTYFFS
ncbi:hypothetical protein L596_023410 [Steinernema carpocapsae]|uniref:DNA-directed RNA polymerase n=1 Tax=Steinernema carpocapsae TaxID=34508 RepID=A0A4V5ZZD9_STECR|nr:hypothetical protein L596_023410 [Steinernema carpocapsae]